MAGVARVWRSFGYVVFRFRDCIAPIAVAIAVASARRADFIVDPFWSWLLLVAGACLLATGQLIRIGVAGYGVVRRAGVKRRISASRLLTYGPYAHTRNPLYLANMMLLGGLAAIYGSRPVLLIGVPILMLTICAIVAAEEEFLTERFGSEYATYRGRVNRFVPRLRGTLATMGPMPFDVRRAIRREYGTVFSVVSTALALLARKCMAMDGLRGARAYLFELALIWGVCALAYAFVRWMKKTKRLETIPEPLGEMACSRDPWG